ncbi:DUF6082 family protein [Streptomyces sp. NPDC059452]|uniref:DUF6082 family protein n=1 Tax=Streptomyces sp. NPDC059452 TaxID=3346835 RepID=UPI0036AD31C5
MKITTAVLVAGAAAAGVGVAHLWQAERHQRQRNALSAAAMHQEYLRYVEGNPELQRLWVPEDGSLDPEEYLRRTHANHLFSALAVRFRVGIIDEENLRVQANWMMSRAVGRDYWSSFSGFRESEARDKLDRRFNRIMTSEWLARPEVDALV